MNGVRRFWCAVALSAAASVSVRAPAQDPWTKALAEARVERLAAEAESERVAASRRTATDALRERLLATLARAEQAEIEAARLAANAEAEAFGVELAERRAEADDAEVASWRELLRRRAAELPDPSRGRGIVPPPKDAAVVDAALAYARVRDAEDRGVRLADGAVVVGALQRFRLLGAGRALAGRADDPRDDGPFEIEGVDALAEALRRGERATWFPLDPSARLKSAVAADGSFAGWVRAGGPIVVVILGLGGLAALLALVRAAVLLRAGATPTAADARARAWLAEERGPAPNVEAALDRVVSRAEAMFLRLQTFFASVVATAPLLGLLGTVTGMIKTFDALTRTGGGDVRALSGGISEALITTEAGLTVAIPLLLIHALLGARARRLIDATEEAAARVLGRAGVDA